MEPYEWDTGFLPSPASGNPNLGLGMLDFLDLPDGDLEGVAIRVAQEWQEDGSHDGDLSSSASTSSGSQVNRKWGNPY